jgi:hypothetical protein
VATDRRTLEVVLALKDQGTGPLRAFGSNLRSFASSAIGSLRSVTGGFFGLQGAIGGIVAALSVRRFVQFTKDVADSADQATKAALALGVTTESLTAIGHAAELSGATFEQLTKGLQTFERNVGQARRGAKDKQRALSDLGITTDDLNKSQIDLVEVLAKAADRYTGLADPIERATALSTLFGDRAGPRLAVLLSQGGAGIRKMAEEARALGIAFGEDTAREFEAFNDALGTLGKTAEGTFRDAFAKVLPEVTDALRGLIEFIKNNRQAIVDGIASWASGAIDAFGVFIDVLATVTTAIKAAVVGWNALFAGARVAWMEFVAALPSGEKDAEAMRIQLQLLEAAQDDFRKSLQAAADFDWDQYTRQVERLRIELEKLRAGGPGAPITQPTTDIDNQTKAANKLEQAWRGVKDGFNQYAKALGDTTDFARKAVLDLAQGIQSAMATAFEAIIVGTKSVSQAFKDLLVDVLRILAKMLAEFIAAQLAAYLVRTILGGSGPAAAPQSGGGGGGGGGGAPLTGGGALGIGTGGGAPLALATAGIAATPARQTNNVTIQFNAVDAAGLDQVLLRRRSTIEAIVASATQQRRDLRVNMGLS